MVRKLDLLETWALMLTLRPCTLANVRPPRDVRTKIAIGADSDRETATDLEQLGEQAQPSETERYYREMAEQIGDEWTGPHKNAVRVALAIMVERIIREMGL